MNFVIATCKHCQKPVKKTTSHYNRAIKLGANIYCSHKCMGFARRTTKDEKVKVKVKAEYDRKYRIENLDALKLKKHEWFKRTYDKEKAAIYRRTRMAKHIEYCRRPEYKEWKKQYDQIYHAKKEGGEFWESLILVKMIQKEYDDREVRQQNNLHNKNQKRKRSWKAMTKNSQQQI